jgi:DNA-binding response OmpR family regulator
MRRARTAEPGNSLAHGPLVLHVDGRVATWHGELVPLTKKEYWLLEAMLRQRSRVLSRAQLEDALYGWGEETESNTIEVYIHHLRRKFCTELIVTVRGLGYQICNEAALALATARPTGSLTSS